MKITNDLWLTIALAALVVLGTTCVVAGVYLVAGLGPALIVGGAAAVAAGLRVDA